MTPSSRAAALSALSAVLDRRRTLEAAFDAACRGLEGRDRAFARALLSLTLRRLGEIDAILSPLLERPLAPAARPVLHILRLAAAQILFLKTPPHAAVSTAVDLARDRGFPGLAGLVNAVARRIARMPEPAPAPGLNLPEWLSASWGAAYGSATVQAIAQSLLAEPPLDLSVAGDPAPWAAALGAQVLPTGTLRLARGHEAVEALPGWAEGAWWVQDAAAALPARLLGDVAGLAVADLCAAPGGKTMQLAAAGARVTAVDRSAPRLARLSENLARTHLSAEIVRADLTRWSPPAPFDAVLIDAPCSATGTLRRHPDAAHLKSPADVAKLARLQRAILERAPGWVKPGGTLVYCVCSLEAAEEAASPAAPPAGFAPLPAEPAEIGGWDFAIRPDGALRTLPCHLSGLGGMDGFYAARFRRL